MIAIYKRETASMLRSMIGWVVIAVLLGIAGIYFTNGNLNYGLPYFGYVLSSVSFFLVFLCPALTMRTFAEEKRQKTDQLLLTAPVSVGSIVMGKYLALLTVFAIPTGIFALYPLCRWPRPTPPCWPSFCWGRPAWRWACSSPPSPSTRWSPS